MKIEDLRRSGLLELYVIGEISDKDKIIVEEAIQSNPSLRKDIFKIEKVLESYAQTIAINPSATLKSSVLKSISTNSNLTSGWNWIHTLLCFFLIALAWLNFSLYQSKSKLKIELAALSSKCDSIENIQQRQLFVMQEVQNPNVEIIRIQASEKFPATHIYLYTNPVNEKNFLQFQDLPPLATNQSFQLWSLKGDLAIPLDVFQGEGNPLIEVEFFLNSDAYAITIEPFGGVNTPTLSNLIGVFSLTG